MRRTWATHSRNSLWPWAAVLAGKLYSQGRYLLTDLLSRPFPLLISRASYCARLAFIVPPSVSSFSPTVIPLMLDFTFVSVWTSARNSRMSDMWALVTSHPPVALSMTATLGRFPGNSGLVSPGLVNSAILFC